MGGRRSAHREVEGSCAASARACQLDIPLTALECIGPRACTYHSQTPDSSLIIRWGRACIVIVFASRRDVCTAVAQCCSACCGGTWEQQLSTASSRRRACRQHLLGSSAVRLRVSAELLKTTIAGPASCLRGTPASPWRSASRFGRPTCKRKIRRGRLSRKPAWCSERVVRFVPCVSAPRTYVRSIHDAASTVYTRPVHPNSLSPSAPIQHGPSTQAKSSSLQAHAPDVDFA
jgi:hypothetical protein